MEERVRRFLAENLRFREVLDRAVKHEEDGSKKPHYFGWEWHDVRAYPVELMKLVREGICEIKYKSRRYTHYVLVDREATKKALTLPSSSKSFSDVTKIQEKYLPRLMSLPGVIGVGIGGKTYSPKIIVNVVKLTKELADEIPKELDGIQVEILETGIIKPL